MTSTVRDLPAAGRTTVLQASAGTGKTYAIASLAARYVAAGVPIDRLLMITFGRAATAELRDRVRDRLLDLHAGLVGVREPDPGDEVAFALHAGTETDRQERSGRLAQALADFDAATISTTHAFCSQMLTVLGLLADTDPGLTLVDSATELVADTATDLYLRAFGHHDSPPAIFDFELARVLAKEAAGDPISDLEAADAEPGTTAALRLSFANSVRDELGVRKRRGRIQDYDDLQLSLDRAVHTGATGALAATRLRERYDVVLVDEFQDTDPVQWRILETLFHRHATLVLIGDPKQAIYAFRGGDIDTYLRAVDSADDRATLDVNRRTDQPLLAALEVLMGGTALGAPSILVEPVAAHHADARIGGPAEQVTPLRLRVVDGDAVPAEGGQRFAPVGQVRPHIAADVARDIVTLLSSGATTTVDGAPRPLTPRDVAVLVGKNSEGALVRDALVRAGVPVVLSGTSSVFRTDSARDWRTLLTALEQLHRVGLTRAVALTVFVGWSAEQLATAGEEERDQLSETLRTWAAILEARGVAALLETIAAGTDLAARVLAAPEGERRLTDLRHIGQALHVEWTTRSQSLSSLVAWLGTRITEAAGDVNDERSRRLESESDAVQVVTVHRSKGLEYPIVYAPFLWDRYTPRYPESLLVHQDGRRIRDLGGPTAPRYRDRRAASEREDADEDLRLAYVALTRAQCQVVVWWAPTNNTRSAPLHRLIFGERVQGELPSEVPIPGDQECWQILHRLRDRSAGTVRVEHALPAPLTRWSPPPVEVGALAARTFDRALDLTWRRTSYSGLTAGLHDQSAPSRASLSEPEAPGIVDEPVIEGVVADDANAMLSPMGALPRGADFGTLVHSVYEDLDFTSRDLPGALLDRCNELDSLRRARIEPPDLAEALLPSLLTPLGPLAGGRRLADLRPADVLSELEYEYPLGTADGETIRIADVAGLLRDHLPADDPMRAYADDLGDALPDTTLRGFLGGFIDAVLRVEVGGQDRYVVVDYKTNWLGGEPLTTAGYDRAGLAAAMREAHYPLQALLYSVALHRFLRWRLPGYQPEVHLGGVLYLFVRGMCGPETPTEDGVPAGVFSWPVPPALVVALSALLGGGAS